MICANCPNKTPGASVLCKQCQDEWLKRHMEAQADLLRLREENHAHDPLLA